MTTEMTNIVPNLVYPSGGEIVYQNQMTIEWENPHDVSVAAWYEIVFSDTYDADQETNWVQIATVPNTSESFIWNIPPSIKSLTCRIGIRARGHDGSLSPLSMSSRNFSIRAKSLSGIVVISPLPSTNYFSYVPIIFDHGAVLGNPSQKSYYQIYYSSLANSIDWTLLKTNIQVGCGPIYWDVRNLPSGKDYSLRVELTDGVNFSTPVFINNIYVQTFTDFVIDTTPPTGVVRIQGTAEYTRNRDIRLSATGFDETTGVQYLTIKQSDDDTEVRQPYANIALWRILGEDGVKFVQARFEDYGSNTLSDDGTKRYFRTLLEVENREVLTFLVDDGGVVWTVLGGSVPELYSNLELETTLPYPATSICMFNSAVFLGLKNTSNCGIMYRYAGSILTSIYTFTEFDSVITSMAVFDDKLLLGFQNGLLFSYDSVDLVSIGSFTGEKISGMASTNDLLFIFLSEASSVKVMRKVATNTYEFANASIINAYH